MKFDSIGDLPEESACRVCAKTKPIAEMVVVRLKKEKQILRRSLCKECNNARERGHRREYKRRYLQLWRMRNAELNESYWRQRQAELRPELNTRAYMRFLQNHDAILIQGRMRRQLGECVSLAEARGLLKKHGCCYPTRFGLTPKGLRECERIRSRFRSAQRSGQKIKMPRPIEIRMMVYDEGGNLRIKPRLQKQPYRRAAQNLHEWHVRRGSPNSLLGMEKAA
jgi:hypothetical protein